MHFGVCEVMKLYLFQQTSLELWIYVVASLVGITSGVSRQVLSKGLHDYLFEDYDTNLLPICTDGENVTVTMDVALRQIMELNEPIQILTSNVWMRLKWNDCRLTWDPASYNNLSGITVLYNDVWVPDITLFDSAAPEVMFPERDAYSAYVSSSGSITYNFPSVLTSVCRVNVRYFPFDTQRCSLKFGSWSHHGLNLDLVFKFPYGDSDAFIENNEWDLREFPAERNVLYYNCCKEPYPDITYTVVFQRRPSFYVLTMLFPCILVTFVSALTFILPTESGEKISLEITVLLSLAVFLLVVSESLPPASDNFPIIGSYFAASMVLVSFSLLMTVLILNVFHRGTNGRTVPKWVRTLCFNYIGRVVCVKPGSSDSEGYNIKDKQDSYLHSPAMDTCVDVSANAASETNLKPNAADEPSDSIPNGGTHLGDSNGQIRFLRRFGTTTPEDPTVRLLQDQTHKLNYIIEALKDRAHEEHINSEWRDIANILDRLFLVIYCLVTFTVTIAFMLQNIGS